MYRFNNFLPVKHSLKPPKRYTINALMPASVYQLKIEAHNVAGSSMAEFTFVTLTKEGGEFTTLQVLHWGGFIESHIRGF